MYIVFEGIDTSGKSTQIALLEKTLNNIILTKEPGGTDLGKNIRDLLLSGEVKSKKAEFFMFLSDRAEHFEEIIKPNIDKKIILSDRSFISGIAYALSGNIGLELDELIKLNLFSIDGVLPDMVFLFTLSKETLFERLAKKEHDHIEQRGIEYLLNVQDNLLRVIKKLNIRYTVIDASKEIGEIHKIIFDEIKSLQDKEAK